MFKGNWLPQSLQFFGKFILFFGLFLGSNQETTAQQTLVYTDEIRYYNRGLELFDKEKFAAAQKHFDWYFKLSTQPINKANAAYYSAVCALELFNNDAEYLLNQVIAKYPESTKAKLALFQLGKLHYRNKNNKLGVAYLDKVEPKYLNGSEEKEFHFIYGYCCFSCAFCHFI
jgi:TolA-binding protein